MQREIIPKLDNINIDTSGITITNSPQVNEILTNIDTNVKKAAAYIGKNIKSLDENILDKIEEIKQEVKNLDKLTINSTTPADSANTINTDTSEISTREELKTILQQIQNDVENILAKLPENLTSDETPASTEPQDFKKIEIAINSQNVLLTNIDNDVKRAANYVGRKVSDKADEIRQAIQNLDLENNNATAINIDWNELRNILQDTLPVEIANEILSQSSIQNFEARLNEFNSALQNASANLNNAANAQQELPQILANLTGNIQSVLESGTRDIENEINHIRKLLGDAAQNLEGITQNTLAKIDNEYRNNIEQIFQAMAEELASAIQILRQNAH